MSIVLAHTGHEFHGPAGFALADLGFVLLMALGLVAAWRALENYGTWKIRFALLAAGMLVLAASIAPPIDRAAATTFTAHMLEHLLMMLVAAPLIAAARPELLLMRGLHGRVRTRLATLMRRLEHGVRAPALLAGLAVFTALWLWHVPPLFDAALQSELVHLIQHASFVGAAVLLWRFLLLLPAHGTRFFLPRGMLVFVTMVHSSALGALLVFSGEVWYQGYAGIQADPLSDQQASGLMMWLAGLPLYLGTLGWLVVVWLHRDERENAERTAPRSRPSLHSRSST